MQKRHFEAIAATIAGMDISAQRFLRQVIAAEFADLCQRENPRFDRARFLAASGVDQ